MKAKDTVMNEDQIDWYSLAKNGVGRYTYDAEFLDNILKAQAEISFKAGIKTVVEWIMQPENIIEIAGVCTKTHWINDKTLKAKIKEWDIG